MKNRIETSIYKRSVGTLRRLLSASAAPTPRRLAGATRSILVITSCAAALTVTAALGKDDIPNRLFAGKLPPMSYPPAPLPVKDKVIPVPMEDPFFPVRPDGQPFVLNIDRTVNLTTALNQFYYNPKWRGEEWSPFDQVDDIERATRLMGTWREYDEFSELRILNGWHRWWEKWSGFGP